MINHDIHQLGYYENCVYSIVNDVQLMFGTHLVQVVLHSRMERLLSHLRNIIYCPITNLDSEKKL
jgi:hypothetical protein